MDRPGKTEHDCETREDVAIDIDERVCPCCGGALHNISETVSEMLDFVPARLRVLRIRRPKYGCRACGTIHQAAAPERPIAKGMASPALLAHVLVSKYCDHTPLYRQSQIFARHGVEIERSTLASWVGGAWWWLEPLQSRLAAHVFGSDKIFADDTPIPVLDPGRGRTKTGRLWVYTRDDRPWGGPDPPAAVYFYSPDRKAERPASHLEAFRGVLQVDGYAGFERLTDRGNIVLAACWAHTRRKFFDVHEATGSPIAAEALRRIAELYAIEKSIRGRTAEERRIVRNTQSRPLIESMRPWLETQLGRIPGRGGLAEAIRYTLSRWPALCHFLEDGRIELDNNSVERAIRPVALGRKNHLFAGSDGGAERWATVCSLIAPAELNGVGLGLNRDLAGKPTGVGTLGLVCVGSALAVLSIHAVSGPDASRVIQGIVTGVGFLGAGVIVRNSKGHHVHGLTTAACVWVTACIGAACAVAEWQIVLLGAALALVILAFVGP